MTDTTGVLNIAPTSEITRIGADHSVLDLKPITNQ